MNKLYYGNGECSVEGNVSFITIKYRGAIEIRDRSPKDFYLSATNNTIRISPFRKTILTLNELFKYKGELRIIFAKALSLEGDKQNINIVRVMDYSELLNTNAENMTNKSENLKATYIFGNKVNKTKILKKIIPDLHTSEEGSPKLELNGEDYFGSYHKYIGTAIMMTGARKTKDSQVLRIKRIRAK